MKLTAQQAHVLEHLNRVLPLVSSSSVMRYQLDGRECTAQIEALAAGRLIFKYSDGRLKRAVALDADRTPQPEKNPPGERQAPSIPSEAEDAYIANSEMEALDERGRIVRTMTFGLEARQE